MGKLAHQYTSEVLDKRQARLAEASVQELRHRLEREGFRTSFAFAVGSMGFWLTATKKVGEEWWSFNEPVDEKEILLLTPEGARSWIGRIYQEITDAHARASKGSWPPAWTKRG